MTEGKDETQRWDEVVDLDAPLSDGRVYVPTELADEYPEGYDPGGMIAVDPAARAHWDARVWRDRPV